MIPTFWIRPVWGLQSYIVHLLCRVTCSFEYVRKKVRHHIRTFRPSLWQFSLHPRNKKHLTKQVAVITCDKVINICLLILKCLLSSIYQIWVGLEYKPNKGTQLDHHDNKTQCQPCKRLAGQLFLIPGLVWKRVSPIWMWSLWDSQQPFSFD